MANLAIVSTDSHAGPRVEAYRDYLERRYHDDLQGLIEEEREYLEITSKIGVYSTSQLKVVDTEGAIASGGVEGAWDRGRRIREMDREGIAAEVFLQGHQSASAPFFGANNRYYSAELRMAGVRAYNRWQADMIEEAAGRLIGVIEQTPVADLEEVVSEVRWAGERGFRGLAFSSVSDAAIPQPPLQDLYWEPLWRAAADYGLALVIHVGLGLPQGTTFDLFRQRAQTMKDGDYDRNSTERSVNLMEADQDPRMRELLALNYSPRQALWQLMVGGVFDRYPNLRFVPTEARADWVPATLAHMDARFEAGDTPLQRRPSEYWADHCFAGASFIHRHEVEHRYDIGVRTLTFGRDYPHPEGTWPNTKDWLRAAFSGVPEEEARLILGENAIRCYGLDRSSIESIAGRIGPPVDEILGTQEVPSALVAEFEKRGGFLKDAPPLAPDRLDAIMDEALASVAGA